VIRELRRNTDPLFRQAGLDLAMSGTSNAIHSLREFPRRSYKGAGRNRDRPKSRQGRALRAAWVTSLTWRSRRNVR
jgi:hypothetical protein